MTNNTTWVVVANSSHAKIFKVSHFPKIEIVQTLEHSESRLLDTDLVSSKQGRTSDIGGTRRHAYEQKTDPKHVEFEKFAREISSHLSAACNKGEFSRLYILANPSFLALLRQHFDHQTNKTIIAEIAKDLTNHHQSDIEEVLADLT